MMHLSDFDYHLPRKLIAQNPVEPRDAARLLVYDRKQRTISHETVRELPELLPSTTLLIANNSKVRQSRLFAREMDTDRLYEILILDYCRTEIDTYECMIRGKAPKIGSNFQFQKGPDDSSPIPLKARFLRKIEGPEISTFIFQFSTDSKINLSVERSFEMYGATPLPPYIEHTDAPPERYQTVYAQTLGSAAAPTAGLHITQDLIRRLKDMGHTWDEVTLHVGIGTFLPLREETVESNHLHTELTQVTTETANNVNLHVRQSLPVLAIGTTSFRTLESHVVNGLVQPGNQTTDLFVYPGYRCQVVSSLMTNFHLPKSSLLMLVAAVLANDPDRIHDPLNPTEAIAVLHEIYSEAIREKYRFFSFGDAMLIL